MKKDECSRRKPKKSKVSLELTKFILNGRKSITRTELFETLAEISSNSEDFFDEQEFDKEKISGIVKLFFNAEEICMELDLKILQD